MGDWTNTEISGWTLCVWKSWFEKIAEDAEKGEMLDNEGKNSLLKEIKEYAEKCMKEIANYR